MAKRTLLVLVTLLATVFNATSLQEDSVSFYGGNYKETLPVNEDYLSVHFSFRSAQDEGVLLVATLGNNTGYIAAVLRNGSQLDLMLSQDGEIFILGSISKSDFSSWQTFELQLMNKTLSSSLQNQSFVTHTFAAPLELQTVYFGRPESFFAPLYVDFPSPRYYVGCLANMTLNSRVVQPDLNSDGIGLGCCILPRYPLWCQDTPHSNLTLTFPHMNTTSISFRLQVGADADGLVLLAHTLTSEWRVQLMQGQLQVVTNLSASAVHTCQCPGEFTESTEWYQVDIGFGANSLTCVVDGVEHSVSISPTLKFNNFSPLTLEIGGVSDLVGGIGFMGCLQRLRVNDIDVDASSLEDGSNSVLHLPTIHWNEFSLNDTEVMVTEGGDERLTMDDILIQLPCDEFGDELTSIYQLELENIIHFDVFSGPLFGHLYIGHPAERVRAFDLSNINSADPAHQLGYAYDSRDNISDAVVFRVWGGCGTDPWFEVFPFTLAIFIEERNSSIKIRQSATLQLVVGTRKVITPEMITVEDLDSQMQILITVQFVAVQNSHCSSCQIGSDECAGCEEESAGIVMRDDMGVKFFTQDQVDMGLISFQHFERYSIAPLLIRVGVSAGNEQFDATIPVRPYQGHLYFTAQSYLFVGEGTTTLIRPVHIAAVTSFDDQDPVITYDLLTLPGYGTLQRYVTISSEWVDLDNSSRTNTLSSFTQEDINNDRVRYFQSEPFSLSDFDKFEFRLRSYNLSGPVVALQVDIYPLELFTPSLNVQVGNVIVREDGSAHINHTVLNTSLEGVAEPSLQLDIQQLDFIYTLVESPSYGILELRGEALVAGDIFSHSDITSNSLIYLHGDSEIHRDQFSFYVKTNSTTYLPIRAPNRTSNMTVDIDVTPVNDHFPVLHGNLEMIQPPEGCFVPVTAANINVTDMDMPSEHLRIHLKRKGAKPTGIFALRTAPDVPIPSFYMSDILNEAIIFVHTLNASASLSYTQILRIDDGVNTIRKPIVITAVPLVLNISLPSSGCFGMLDADLSSLTVSLNGNAISASLFDHFGNNTNLVPDIVVTLLTPPLHGEIFLNSSQSANSTAVSQFQFRDKNKLVYVLEPIFRNATGDMLSLQFSYGHSIPVVYNAMICIQPVLSPLTLQTSPVEVMQGGMNRITLEHLIVTSSREEKKNSLIFYVDEGPRHGAILNDRTDDMTHSLSQFTHGDLSSNVIVYEHHRDPTSTQDSLVLRVCSDFSCLERVLHIEIYPVSLSIQNATIYLREGGEYQFSHSDFNVSAPSHYDIDFIVKNNTETKTKTPKHGRLYINTATHKNLPVTHFVLGSVPKLRYNNTDLEHLQDCVEMTVEAAPAIGSPLVDSSPTLSLDFILRIVLEPVNNHAPEVNKHKRNLTVVQGGSALIPSNLLTAHDYDAGSDDNDLVWSIPSFLPLSGYLYLDTDSGYDARTTTWREEDIRNNRLYYRNNKIYNEDVLVSTVTDGEKQDKFNLHISIVSVIIKEYGNVTLTRFSLGEGDRRTITYEFLRYYSYNVDTLNDSDFLITIRQPPQHGRLTLNGDSVSEFTQDKIESGLLVYAHDHSNTIADNFTFLVEVPSRPNSAITRTFAIEIDPEDDDPPVVFLPPHIFVVELELVEIGTEIRIEDFDSTTILQYDQIKCQLVQLPMHGRLEKRRLDARVNHTEHFTKYDVKYGKLWYRHLGQPRPDFVAFNVTDGAKNKQPEIYNLTIIVLPRVVTLMLGRLTVTEGLSTILTSDEITVTHPYLSTVKGTIRLIDGPTYGIFINIKKNQRHLTSFTTEDLANESISYFHNGSESLQDRFRFVYESEEPTSRMSNEETFYIDITPVDDHHPMIANDNTSFMLWTTETVILRKEFLDVTDFDTPADKLNITFRIDTDLGGYIALATDIDTNINWFTQLDILNEQVVFVHSNGRQGELVYNVTDGVHIQSGLIMIFADPLYLDCDTEKWKSIAVDFLGSVTVTSAHLFCTTSDVNERNITYTPLSRLGHFQVNSEIRSHFSSTEINAGLVTYVHTETGMWLQTEHQVVSAASPPASLQTNLPLVIKVSYPQPPPGSQLAVNNGLRVAEGGSVRLDQSTLDGRNLRYASWVELEVSDDTLPDDLTVLYDVVDPPSHGNITLNGNHTDSFTQTDLALSSLQYTHDDSETLEDSLIFNVTIEFNGNVLSQHLEYLLVTVDPLNDQRPVLRTVSLEKVLVQNFEVKLGPDDLEITDRDNAPGQLYYRLVSSPNNTQMLLHGELLTNFTQEDIINEDVVLSPFAVGVSSFSFRFSDLKQNLESENLKVVNFVLTVEEQFLFLINSEEITSIQTETSTVISNSHINTSTNGYRADTVFTVNTGPHNGLIVIMNQAVQNFTQVDVDQSRVKYVSNGDTYQDAFSLDIKNHDLTCSVNMTVRIIALWETGEVHTLDFNEGPSPLVQVLPSHVLLLDQIQDLTSWPPDIELIEAPQYGHLEMVVTSQQITKRSDSPNTITKFRYDDLENGWIRYVWDYRKSAGTNLTVVDSFAVLVTPKKLLPGEAIISVTLSPPPPLDEVTTITTSTTTTRSPAPTDPSSGSGFPVFTLVPIIGIILFLLLLILIVVAFCLTQQKKIQKKWVPTISHHQRQSPWSSSSPPIPTQVTHYDLDPSGMHYDLDPSGMPDHHSDDTSSGFSEPDCSPRHTPIQSTDLPLRSSPSYPPPRSRMRSNVSITFSGRHSEFSADDGSLHSSLSQYPPQRAALSVRPASHTAYNRPLPTIPDSGVTSMHSANSLSQSLGREGVKNTTDDQQDLKHEETLAGWTEGTAMPDFNDPDVQRLFYAHSPVLKKEEYWV